MIFYSQFIPFARGNSGNIFSFQNDGELTVGCLFDKSCDKKVWIQEEKSNGEKILTNGLIKCIESEFEYKYIVKYNSAGKQILNKKIIRIDKIVPQTILYKLYDYYCNEKDEGPAFSMNLDELYTNTKYYISVNKAYFFEKPDSKTKKNNYLVYGDQIYPLSESKYFYYIEYKNANGIITKGWIIKDDVQTQ